jgi:hypothetical protein
MRGRQGIEVVARSAFVFTVEHGYITRFRLFQERAEAFEAVGMQDRRRRIHPDEHSDN